MLSVCALIFTCFVYQTTASCHQQNQPVQFIQNQAHVHPIQSGPRPNQVFNQVIPTNQVINQVIPNNQVFNQVIPNNQVFNQVLPNHQYYELPLPAIPANFVNNQVVANQGVTQLYGNPVFNAPCTATPVISAKIVEHSVTNTLANALQLLIVSDLIESTINHRDHPVPVVENVEYVAGRPGYEVVNTVEGFYPGCQEYVPVTELVYPGNVAYAPASGSGFLGLSDCGFMAIG